MCRFCMTKKLFVKSRVLGGIIIPIVQMRKYRQLSEIAQGHELACDRVRARFRPQ